MILADFGIRMFDFGIKWFGALPEINSGQAVPLPGGGAMDLCCGRGGFAAMLSRKTKWFGALSSPPWRGRDGLVSWQGWVRRHAHSPTVIARNEATST